MASILIAVAGGTAATASLVQMGATASMLNKATE